MKRASGLTLHSTLVPLKGDALIPALKLLETFTFYCSSIKSEFHLFESDGENLLYILL